MKNSTIDKPKKILSFIMLLAASLITFIAFKYYNYEKSRIESDLNSTLESVSKFKADILKNWINERKSDASFLSSVNFLNDEITLYLADKNNIEIKEHIARKFDIFRERYDYSNIILLDENGDFLFSVIDDDKIFNPKTKEIIKNNKNIGISFLDFYNADESRVYSDILYPVKSAVNSKIAGYIVIRINPEIFIYPTLKKIPIHINSSESCFFENNNGIIKQIFPEISIVDNHNLFYDLLNGNNNKYYGKGNNGQNIYAYIQKIEDTNFYLTIQVDESEVLDDFYTHIAITFAGLFFILLFVFLILYLINKEKQKKIFKELYSSELALRINNERFKTILYSIGDGVITTDESGNITQMNFIAEQLTGWKEIEAKNNHIDKIFNIIDGRDNSKAVNPVYEVMETGKIVMLSNHTVLISKNGKRTHIADSAAPIFDDKGNTTGVVLVIRDQTTDYKHKEELQKTAEKYKYLIENLHSGVVVHNPDTSISICNNESTRILGLSKEQMEGKVAIDPEWHFVNEYGIRLEPEDYPVNRVINSKQPIKNEIFGINNTERGYAVWVIVNAYPELDEKNGIVQIIVTFTDFTEQKLTEEKIRASEEAIRLSEEKLRIVADNTYHWEFWEAPDGKSLYHSPSCENILGIKADDLLEDCSILQKMIHPDDLNDYLVHHNDTRNEFKPRLHYFRLINKFGVTKYIEHICQPVFDNDNKFLGIRGTNIDITERKVAEEKLIESEERLNNIVNSQTNYVLRTDLEGKHTYWNKKFEEEFGWVYKDVGIEQGDALASICDYHHTRTKEAVEICIKNPGTVLKVELDKPSSLNGFRTTLWEFVCLQDSDGNPSEIQCMGIDITDRKIAEQKLLESEEKYRSLFYDSPDAYLLIKDGKFIDCNKASELMIGTIRDNILGLSPANLSPEVQPNGKNSFEYAEELINETFIKGNNSFEWIHKKNDGTEFLALINLSVVNFDNEKVIFTTWRDITEIRKAEQQVRILSQAVEQNPISIVITNKDGNIEYANPAACRTTGYSMSELYGKNPRVLKSGETTDSEYNNLWNSITSGLEWRGIFHNKRKNGELYWESSTIAPIQNSNGEITHFIAIKEDITERKKIQEALQKSEQRFSEIAKNSRTVIWEVDTEGLYTYVSPVAKDVFGYEPDELIGKLHFYDLHPEEMKQKYLQDASEFIKTGQIIENYENPICTKEGRLIWVSTNGTPVYNNKNEITGYRGSDIDITNRKIAEDELRKFRIISDQANYGTAMADFEGNLIYANHEFAKMHGWELNELIGKNLAILHAEEHLPRVRELLVLIEKQGGFTAEEVWRIKKDGTAFPSLMNTMLIRDEQNIPQFMSASVLDITDLKKSEAALIESETQLNYAQEIANMGSWEFNVRTSEVKWSKNYYKLLGIDISQKPLSLEEIKQRVHEDDREIFENSLVKIATSKQMDSLFFRLLNIDGSVKWIQANIVPVYEGDELIAVKGVSIDITDKKESEEVIKKQNEKLNAIISAIPDLIFIIKNDGEICEYYANEFEATLMPREQIIGSNIKYIFDDVTFKRQIDYFNTCIEKNELITYEYSTVIDNEAKFYESRIVPIDNDKVLAFVRNITERKEKENEIKKLTLAIEQSPVSIVITDLEANIQYVSPAFFVTTGYTFEEVIGKNASILKSGKTDNRIYKAMWATIESGKPWQGEWINKKKDGTLYWENISITPIHNENKEIVNYLAIKQDITDRKNAEQEIKELNHNLEGKVKERTLQLEESNVELKKARIEADAANIAKSEFLSRMSHELRTPMNSILGFAQILEMGELDTHQQKSVNHILKSGRHLLDLINEVLDISRIEAGRISLSLEPVEVNSVVSEMIDTIIPHAQNKQISVINELKEVHFINADRQRLKQILLNLISNSIKYNNEGGYVKIFSERFEYESSDKGKIRLYVQDNGVGISEEDVPKLFTPFERIGAEKTDTEGTGLGLAVVKKLVDVMGGKLGVESEIGSGSTFWIEFSESQAQVQKLLINGGLEASKKLSETKTGTILYIEDNVSNIELIELILSGSRTNINLITNMYGKQAVQLAVEYKPDLILLDLNLPDIHGSEVLKNLQDNDNTKHIPVIVISADAMPKQLSNLLQIGAKNYLTKPIDVNVFLEEIDKYIK